MAKSSIGLRTRIVVACCALLLVACSSESPDVLMSSARDYLGKNDHAAAIIQLKNVLQEQPDRAEARFLLGQALLMTGNPAGAQSELDRAIDLGYAQDEATPLLAQAMLAQGQYKPLTDAMAGIELTTPAARAELNTFLAVAWRQQGNIEAFLASLDKALNAKPDHAPARIEQALHKASLKSYDDALGILDEVLKSQPNDISALKMRGDVLLYGKQEPDLAQEAYRSALKIKPGFRDAQVALVRLLLSQNLLEDASKEQAVLKALAPGHPQTLYLQAQLALLKQDNTTARDQAQQLLKLLPDDASVMELAGTVEYQMNALKQAESLLARAVQARPELRSARRMLVLTYLRAGQVDKALAALPSNIDADDPDPAMLQVAGQAHMTAGDFERAQAYFQKASALDPKDPAKRTSLAISRLMAGKSDLAMVELREIADADAGIGADMALISAHMQRRESAKALKAIDALEQKRPDDPLSWQLRARAQLMVKDTVGARKSLEQALVKDPDHMPAMQALAALDLAEKKPVDAQKRFEEALKRQPDSSPLYLAMAEVRAASGARADEVLGLLRKAIAAAPSDARPQLALIEYQLASKDPKGALASAQAATAALPDSLELQDGLGRAQLANGEHNQALSTFGKLARLQPESPVPHLRMASVHAATKDASAAAGALQKALQIQPDLLSAQRGLAGLALQSKDTAKALEVSRTIQKQRPAESAGYALEGDILASVGRWAEAVQAYQNGYKRNASAGLAMKLHSALSQSDKGKDAEAFAADFLKKHPDDATFPLYLGDRALSASEWALARKQYLRVLEIQPRNALALNNLAWASGQLQMNDAISFAEKANAEVPGQPAFMDTLAMLLSRNNEHARAIELQKKVVAAQPGAPVFRLNLAKIWIQSGDVEAAKPLLDAIQREDGQSTVGKEAAQLRQTL